MRILVIGSGGREHALAWKLSQSPEAEAIFVAPGNGGTAAIARNVDISPSDIAALTAFAQAEKIDLVVPGPELPLTLGITDAMRAAGIPCFGPDTYCANLEGSKNFAKDVMAAANVPTASHAVFEDAEDAREYVKKKGAPLVVKADGLAAGKGVVVASTVDEALAAIDDMMEKSSFGKAGDTILIEEKLDGEEVSLLCFCDGATAVPLPSAQDHKAAFDNDLGPNTGGMGAYSPAPVLPDEKLEEMADIVIRPVLAELAKRGHPFTGVLYAGLMMTENGPKVLEYNVRFGDPECQPLLLRLNTDLLEVMRNCVNGNLAGQQLDINQDAALGVVLAAAGYPGKYEKGQPLSGLDKASEKAVVFHSGTAIKDGQTVSSGGRVLCVTGRGQTLAEAQKAAYDAIGKIQMPESRYRSDIGAKGIKRQAKNQ